MEEKQHEQTHGGWSRGQVFKKTRQLNLVGNPTEFWIHIAKLENGRSSWVEK